VNEQARQIIAQCGRCGLVEITVSSIVVHTDPEGTLYGHTRCPACLGDMWEELAGTTGDLLIRLGARRVTSSFSPELLEHRPGPPITERDVKRFVRALRRSDPAEEARRLS
jgi:hypothetical protein